MLWYGEKFGIISGIWHEKKGKLRKNCWSGEFGLGLESGVSQTAGNGGGDGGSCGDEFDFAGDNFGEY